MRSGIDVALDDARMERAVFLCTDRVHPLLAEQIDDPFLFEEALVTLSRCRTKARHDELLELSGHEVAQRRRFRLGIERAPFDGELLQSLRFRESCAALLHGRILAVATHATGFVLPPNINDQDLAPVPGFGANAR